MKANIEYLQKAIKKLAGTSVGFNMMEVGKASWYAIAMMAYCKIEKPCAFTATPNAWQAFYLESLAIWNLMRRLKIFICPQADRCLDFS
jgi:hypothetical protein